MPSAGKCRVVQRPFVLHDGGMAGLLPRVGTDQVCERAEVLTHQCIGFHLHSFQTGGRFSRNARMPSLASSPAWTMST